MPKEKIKFRVQSVAKMKFDNHFLGTNLSGESAKPRFVGVCRSTKGKLKSELLGERLLQADGGLVVEFGVMLDDAVCTGDFLLGERLHSNQKSATLAFATCPTFDMFIKLTPASQVKVTDTKIGTVRDGQGRLESWEQLLVDIVENAWHRM
jgi:hypothetical protein